MKIGFIGLPSPGHLNPMSALARQLQSRNHDVVMFSPPVGESLARAAGLPFVPFAEKEFSAYLLRDCSSRDFEKSLNRLNIHENRLYRSS